MRAGPQTYPLTPLQQSMVIASLREPAAGFYVPQLVCSLDETLQPTLLREAFAQLVDRHPVLRSAIRLDGEATQSVLESPAIEFIERDPSPLDATTREWALRDLLAADRARGFDFDASPPHRLTLIRMAAEQHRLVWTCHHALIDRHAWLLATNELFGRYDSLRTGETYSRPRRHRSANTLRGCGGRISVTQKGTGGAASPDSKHRCGFLSSYAQRPPRRAALSSRAS